MKYILISIFTTITTLGFGQNHYVSTNDTTDVSRIDTFDTGIHGYDISYHFKDSLANGTWHLLYGEDTSRPRRICTFKNQKRNGVNLAYNRDGQMTMDAYYINDTIVHIVYYYNGKITMECLKYALGELTEVVTLKDFEHATRKECRCRSMKEGEWHYSSRKRKRCFLKRLKDEQHKWSTSSRE